MKNTFITLLLVLSLIPCPSAFAQKNPDLAKTPPMGWNSWNWFGKKEINQQIVREVIDAIVNEGLRDAGYIYIVVDGGWRDTKLDPEGRLVPHPVKFPDGIKPLADYAHSKGLKFGLHVVPGTHDCGGDPVGGFNREEIHVRQFVEWGLDFIKLDLCRQKEDPCTSCEKTSGGWSEPLIKDTYIKWCSLLKNCGRDILFSISTYKFRDGNTEYSNMSRTTYDIQCRINKEGAIFDRPDRSNKNYLSVMAAAVNNDKSAKYAGNGYWNDPDMMVTGNQGLSDNEQKSHFALWCIMSAPLMLGNDPRNMTPAEKNLITNSEMIAINQDPEEQGHIITNNDEPQVWAKKLSDGSVAVLLLNLDPGAKKTVSLDLHDIGLSGKVKARDLINKTDAGKFKNKIQKSLDPHECSFLLITQPKVKK